MKKNDIMLILTVVFVSIISFIFIFFGIEKGDTAVIYKNGEIYKEIDLSKDCRIDIGETNTAAIENGSIYMTDANCPDGLCLRQGRISDSSKKIICLPNKVIIEVKRKSETDTVVR